MPRTTRIIEVPKPAKGSYNPHRPLGKNSLLLNQVRHFRMAEEKLPPERRTGINAEALRTEADAADYIRRVTAILHPHVSKAGGR